MPSSSHVTLSPCLGQVSRGRCIRGNAHFIQSGGVQPKPTPGGVPVKIRSPGSSVITCDKSTQNMSVCVTTWSTYKR